MGIGLNTPPYYKNSKSKSIVYKAIYYNISIIL